MKIEKRKSEVLIRRTYNTMAERKRTRKQTMFDKTLHRKLKNEQHEPNVKLVMNSGALDWVAVQAPLVTPVVLLLNT